MLWHMVFIWLKQNILMIVLSIIYTVVALGLSTTILAIENRSLRLAVRRLNMEKNNCEKNCNRDQLAKYRLPDTVKPLLYDLYLYPDLKTGLFTGKVNISLEILKETESVSLHSKGLNIANVKVASQPGTFITEKTYDLLNIKRQDNSKFIPGFDNIEIEFNGDMKNRIVGLYTSSYTTSSGEKRQIATSKFEPTFARQAYPCFDEPNLKAKYKVHLLKPKDSSYIALSNYPVENVTDYDNDHQLVTFDETVSMSTYLSCFIVSDFTHTETSFNNSGKIVPLKVFASPENLDKTRYAGEVGKKVIEYYVQYFQMPYPLPKLDLVAIPDFVSGAMEHWGLVTFRETALLYTNTTHSSLNKQRVATVVAHELAHSWFGNLVTMNWWNDLWLNEGFASYIEYKGVLAAEPTWGMLEQFIITDLHPVLSFDAKLSSHPIVKHVVTPDQITEIFDVISYNKGASILRMLEATVGDEVFQNGVKNYLNRYAFGNAVTKDLLSELQLLVGNKLDVTEMMDTFTLQMGYPILDVAISGDTYTLTQKRFLKDPNAVYNVNETKYKYRWSVPVTYVTNLGKSSEFILFKYSDNQVTIKKPAGATWLKFNTDQIGYYRVNYPLDEWQNIINNYKLFSTGDRTHLLEETFCIAEANQLNYTIPLELTKKLKDEIDFTPWSVATSNLKDILARLRGAKSDMISAYKEYITKIVSPAYNKFTWTEDASDKHLEKLARLRVLSLACSADHKEALEEARSKFNTWIETKQPISPNLRSLVYVYGIKNASESDWDNMLQVYMNETDASEKVKLMDGLSSVDNVNLLKKLLDLVKNESVVRSQDYLIVLGTISINPKGTDLVWDFVRSNWDYLVGRYTLNERNLGNLIPRITNNFYTPDRLQEIEDFFKKYPEAGAGAIKRKEALETVRNNILWVSNYKNIIEDWIVKQSAV
ncbi:glutamyl aminopeptidase isoform X2 [Diabrotica virgifera virgifera]|uniref:Aminopeptidase n=2 Tax=Diabrotica virgifera virgifera TaxID=50390 RepID=A0ABM5IZC9_DIAVI|nr:glutamyl aminopeptidase isoform X2 [Diabrotica virgifera virgifera]